jgi:uncharacterized DUF497 family protein
VGRDEPEAFEWDHAKSERNAAVRGFDFEFTSRVFFGSFVEREDRRLRNYRHSRVDAPSEGAAHHQRVAGFEARKTDIS